MEHELASIVLLQNKLKSTPLYQSLNSQKKHIFYERCTWQNVSPRLFIPKVGKGWSFDQEKHNLRKCVVLSQTKDIEKVLNFLWNSKLGVWPPDLVNLNYAIVSLFKHPPIPTDKHPYFTWVLHAYIHTYTYIHTFVAVICCAKSSQKNQIWWLDIEFAKSLLFKFLGGICSPTCFI